MDQETASLRRYLHDHPGAEDRPEADWQLLSALTSYRPLFEISARWPLDGPQIIEQIDRFAARYPDSDHVPEAMLLHAFVAWHCRPKARSDTAPWCEDDLMAVATELARLPRRYPDTTEAGMALAWRLRFADLASPILVTSDMRAIRAELDKRYAGNREVTQLVHAELRGIYLRMDGELTGFRGTDSLGTIWTAASLRSHITVLHFWATWCAPCIAEIPFLRSAWTRYASRGLQIIGVCLDEEDGAALAARLHELHVEWPQIFDGRGFGGDLPQHLGIQSIPLTLLLDKRGQVVVANPSGGDLLRRLAILFGDLENASP